MNNPVNVILVLALSALVAFSAAAWMSLNTLQWLLIRLYARRRGLIAYRAEWQRAVSELEANPERLEG